MKTGIELIATERQEQIEKHGRTVAGDVEQNHGVFEQNGEVLCIPQLPAAARWLSYHEQDFMRDFKGVGIFAPHGWDATTWERMMDKPYQDRLVIAGALIAAEIDRIQNILEDDPALDILTATK